MLNVKLEEQKINSLNYLHLGYDVSKFKHNFFTKFDKNTKTLVLEDQIGSKISEMKDHFDEVQEFAKANGFQGVIVACEPTGGYEKNLLRVAREKGFFTQYVSGEATAKYKVVESNDNNKSDKKDSRIIYQLTKEGKTLTCEERENVYAQLQFLNRKYEDVSLEYSRLKNMFSSQIDEFFADLQLESKKYYTKTCQEVIEQFQLNPYEIAKLEFNKFQKKIQQGFTRKLCKASVEMLKKIWHAAQSNSLLLIPQWQIDITVETIADLHGRMKDLTIRKEKLRQQMIEVYQQTEEFTKLGAIDKGIFMFARVIAETGALSNYQHYRQVIRYAGLNLRERSSGKFKGQVKLSKKGNILLRKVLGQLAFSCYTQSNTLFGSRYKDWKTKKGGLYGLVNVMRKVLKMMFGVYKSTSVFNPQRVFDQNLELQKASA